MNASEPTPDVPPAPDGGPTPREERGRRNRPRRGESFEGSIETLAYGGRGIVRLDGFVVFVSGGLPGDRIRGEITKSKKGYAEARLTELLEPAADRLPDSDLHQGEACPGAGWQALAYERQLSFKEEHVRDALTRIGRLEVDLDPIVPALEQWRYRNKVEYSFGEQDGELVLGFRPRGRWDEVLDIEDCRLSSEATNRARNELLEWARSEGLNAYDPHDQRGLLRNLVIREGRRTGQIQTRLVTSEGRFPKPPVDLHTVIEGPSGSTSGPTGALGEETLRERIFDLEIELSHESFFQTNTEMAEQLYGLAAEYAGLSGAETLFDLYCGVGTIGLSLAGQVKQVWGLEIVEDAIANAERNARANGITNARFVAANARTGLRPLIEQAGRPDVVTVDPPRAGLSNKIVRRLIECEARRIVYISCNPTTLAPNAAQLVEAGYKLNRVRPVDMFPQTPHIECVARFDLDRSRSILVEREIEADATGPDRSDIAPETA
ncbi:MAG: 23S rRNA (uracil(1939)-C(5))-methyltransferase RlmD [Solirubrobacterales bacterium]|nr:23S rRNA (uracil(1939)-C(5))-methyltransferase RlmD [Solirubrobacterales bacterium]